MSTATAAKKKSSAITKEKAKSLYSTYRLNGGTLSFMEWLEQNQASLPPTPSAATARRRAKKRIVKKRYRYADGTEEDVIETEEVLSDDNDDLLSKFKKFNAYQVAGFSVVTLVLGIAIGVGGYHLIMKNKD